MALVAIVTIAGAALLVWTTRESVLRGVGHMLVAEDRVQAANLIVIAPDVGDAGVLEAAALVERRLGDRVLVIADPLTAMAQAFAARGVPYEDVGARMVSLLHQLGITQVHLLRLPTGGSEETGRALPAWCQEYNVRSLIVVTSTDHSRRLRRVLRRHIRARAVPLHVMVHRATYSAFAPDRWWQSRGTLRTGIEELQKLTLDVLMHPFS
jgi:hypothetical protein